MHCIFAAQTLLPISINFVSSFFSFSIRWNNNKVTVEMCRNSRKTLKCLQLCCNFVCMYLVSSLNSLKQLQHNIYTTSHIVCMLTFFLTHYFLPTNNIKLTSHCFAQTNKNVEFKEPKMFSVTQTMFCKQFYTSKQYKWNDDRKKRCKKWEKNKKPFESFILLFLLNHSVWAAVLTVEQAKFHINILNTGIS